MLKKVEIRIKTTIIEEISKKENVSYVAFRSLEELTLPSDTVNL